MQHESDEHDDDYALDCYPDLLDEIEQLRETSRDHAGEQERNTHT